MTDTHTCVFQMYRAVYLFFQNIHISLFCIILSYEKFVSKYIFYCSQYCSELRNRQWERRRNQPITQEHYLIRRAQKKGEILSKLNKNRLRKLKKNNTMIF